MESILTSVKKLLGIGDDYDHFDADIIMHINSVLAILNQLGVGTEDYRISGKEETWEAFIGSNPARLTDVRSYVYLKVRLLFDPPSSSAALDSMNRLANEFEWRLNMAAELTGKQAST